MNNDVNRNVIDIKWQSKEIYKREMGNLLIYSQLPVLNGGHFEFLIILCHCWVLWFKITATIV